MKWLPVIFIVLLSCAGSNHPKFIAMGQSYTNRIENRKSIEAPIRLEVDMALFPSYKGTLTNMRTKSPITGTRVIIHGEKVDRPATTDTNGNFTFLVEELVVGFTVEANGLPPVRMNLPPDYWDWYKRDFKLDKK